MNQGITIAASIMGQKGGKIGGAKKSAKKTEANRRNIRKRWAGIPVIVEGDRYIYSPGSTRELRIDNIGTRAKPRYVIADYEGGQPLGEPFKTRAEAEAARKKLIKGLP